MELINAEQIENIDYLKSDPLFASGFVNMHLPPNRVIRCTEKVIIECLPLRSIGNFLPRC